MKTRTKSLRSSWRYQGRLDWVVLAGLLLAPSAWADDYACYVSTIDQSPAIVLVDAPSRTEAQAMARQAQVRTRIEGKKAQRQPVANVFECVVMRRERFKEPVANQLLERLPL